MELGVRPHHEDVWAGLRVRAVSHPSTAPDAARIAVVLLHGFGASGDDLLPVAESLVSAENLHVIVPEGPLALPDFLGGRAWWTVDFRAIERALRLRKPRDLRGDFPAGLPEARNVVDRLLDEVRARLRPTKLVLGGFSQGAMLSCDRLLCSDQAIDAAVLLSGTLLAADHWRPGLRRREKTPLFVSHGFTDEILSFSVMDDWAQEMAQAGHPLTWVPFSGGHEIPAEVVSRLAQFLSSKGAF